MFGFLCCLRHSFFSIASYLAFTQPTLAYDLSTVGSRRHALATAGAAATGLVIPTASGAASVATTTAPSFDGSPFPLVSFGLQIYDDDTAYKLTMTALEVGYRNFFASVLAGNQRGFARAVRDSGVARSDLFICGSVVSNRAKGYAAAKQSTTRGWQENMNAFAAGKIDYLDQIMLDYPGPDRDSILGQWNAFQEMKEEKLTRTLSVSNFSPTQLDYIISDPSINVKPLVNQLPFSVAYHPGNSIEENSKRDVLVQAWAPLGGSLGGRFTSQIKGVCSEIGKKYNKSGSQIGLRWIIQKGAAVCTQTKKKNHFIEDLNILDFEISPEDMKILDELA